MSVDQSKQKNTAPPGSSPGSVQDAPLNEDVPMRIEDMPLEKKLEILKKFNHIDYYEENRFIDAMDSVNQWCLGQIVTVDKSNLNIHFDGWSNRWDTWQKVNSYKIAPFRKNSKGYTGQNKVALRQNLTFTLDDLQLQKQRVQKFIDNDMNGFGAFETTQYLRGQLYVYVDFLMQHSGYTEDQIDAINDFLYHVLRLIVTWIKKLPKLVSLYSQVKVNPDLFLIDENIAILLSAYELMDILKKLFCCCHRCVKYYIEHDKNAHDSQNQVTESFVATNFQQERKTHDDLDLDDMKHNIIQRKKLIYGQFINFVNAFAEMGGFDAIIDFLKIETENPDERIPLEMFSLMTLPFRNCNEIFAKTFANQFVLSIRDIVMNRLRNMTEKELKEIDKESVSFMLLNLKDFLTLSLDDIQTAEIIEQNQLMISLRFLKSTYLEKRLKGITDIKTMIERIEQGIKLNSMKNVQIMQKFKGNNMDVDMLGNKLPKPPKWLTAETMRDWILNEKILDIVYGESTHLEIVKRSGCILKFLAKQGALPHSTVDLIWKQQGKHEEMVRVIYLTIQDIVPHVDSSFINLFFEKIKQVPAVQYDDKFLEFLKDFTQKSLESFYEQMTNESSIEETSAIPYEEAIQKREYGILSKLAESISNINQLTIIEPHFGLPIFWEMIQDKAPQVSNEIMQGSIQSICDILRQNHSSPLRLVYLLKAFENISKGESIVQSIIIAQNIIGEYSSNDYTDVKALSQKVILIQASNQLGLIDKVIQNIVTYHSQVKDKVNQMVLAKKEVPSEVGGFVFVGKHSHEQMIQNQLNFLEFMIIQSDSNVKIGIQNIDTLWQYFVHQPNFSYEQNLFLKWINHHRENQYDKRNEYFLFDDEERKYFFTKILCNPTYVDQITYAQVKCFHKYFKVINGQEQNMNSYKKKMRVINYKGLIGLETLWKISIESQNEKAKEDSMDLLVDLHLKFDQSLVLEEQQKIWAHFIENCMKNLESENERLVSNTLQLISRFLDRFEGKKTLKPEFKASQFASINPMNIPVIDKQTQVKRSVQCSYFQTFGYLRTKIAEAFDLHLNEFLMVIKNSYFDPDEDDDRYIKELGMIQGVILVKNPNYDPENHPKFLISNVQANYDKLFFLLSKENPHLIETSWDLLQKLPINAKLQQEIKELSGVSENKKNWEKILDPKSTNKLLYSLRILNSMHISNKKDQKSQQWCFKFVSLGGFTHLLKTFIGLDLKQIDTGLTMKCVELLIIILYDFINYDKELSKSVMGNKEAVIMRCVNLIDLIVDFQIAQEKKRGYSFEDVTKRIAANKQKKNRYKAYIQGNKGPADNKQQQSVQEDEDDIESQEYNQAQSLNKSFNEDSKIVSNLFKFMTFTVFASDPTSPALIVKYKNLDKLLLKASIVCENWYIRSEVLNKFREILNMKYGPEETKMLQEILHILLFQVQVQADHYEQRTNNFFEILPFMIDSQTPQEFQRFIKQSEDLILELSNYILTREIKEKNTQDVDFLLRGRMGILKSLLYKLPHCKLQVGNLIGQHLIHNCLFEVPQGSSTKSQALAIPPKCKNIASRRMAQQLLVALCRDCIPNLNKVLDYMHEFNHNPSWRTNKEIDWGIQLMDEKSSTGYVGIKNLGCICYMLSLFQQLFMISSFRNEILSVKDPNFEKVEKDENMLYQLQSLFAGLLKSEKQYVSPKGFCHAFKDYEGQPVNVVEQMDVDEFLNLLMDRLETAIKGSSQQHTIVEHFGGKFADEKICKGCPHKYESTEPFLSFSISVKNKKSIIEGLNAFVQGDMLEGDNAYYCEKCDKKVETLKRQCVKELPKYMIIALKRFEFDYDKMIKVKVNDYCEFPMEFSMEPFTQEGLARREKFQKMTEEKGEDNEQEIQMDPLKYPQDYYDYTLSGVVVHTGTADSGHYYSFVKDREHPESGKWYELNDHIVRDFDPNDIPQECFGGEETFQSYNMVQMKSMKWRNAYLLFYERKCSQDLTKTDEENVNEQSESANNQDVIMTASSNSQEVSIIQEIEEKIAYDNQKYWQNRFLFANEYPEFVHDLSLTWNTSCLIPKQFLAKNNDSHLVGFPIPKEYEFDVNINEPLDVKLVLDPASVLQMEEKVFKFAAQFYITILQRSSNKQYIPQMLNLLKAYINKNSNCARWIITEFCNSQILEENLLHCNSKEMRKFIVGLLYCSMLKVFPEEKDVMNDYWTNPLDPSLNKSVIGNLALVLLHKLFLVKKFIGHSQQYFQLLARISSLGTEAREFLLKGRTIGRLMEFFFDEVSPHKEFFRDYSEINPLYKENPDIGLPTKIDKKQLSHFQDQMEKRRLKALQEAPPKYKFLIEAVSNCIRGFKHFDGPKSIYQLDEIPYGSLLSQERDLYIPEAKFLKRVFHESRKNRSLKYVCMSYIHFCWNEKEGFNELLGVISNGLTDGDYDEIRPYLILLQFALSHPGSANPEQRFEALIQTFLEIVKQNQIFYKFMEVVIEFVFKIVSKIAPVKQWFAANKQAWAYLALWSQDAKFPIGYGDQQNNLRVFKKRNNLQLNTQYLRNEFSKNTIVRESRLKRMELLIKDVLPDLADERDMDLTDLQDYKFVAGEIIEVYTRKQDKVQQVQVEQVLDEMIQVKYLNVQQQEGYQSNLQWFGCDTDKLMPNGTYKNQYRNRLYEHLYIQQQKLREAQNAQQLRQGVNPNDMEMDINDNGVNQNFGDSEEDNDSDNEGDIYN